MNKRDVVLALLAHGEANIHVNCKTNALVLPPYLYAQDACVLTFGWNMPRPIPDLVVGDEGMSGTLSFSKAGFTWCYLPWESVWGVVGHQGKGQLWTANMPESEMDKLMGAAIKDAFKARPEAAKLVAEHRAKLAKDKPLTPAQLKDRGALTKVSIKGTLHTEAQVVDLAAYRARKGA